MISNNKVYTGLNDPEINLRWDWNSLLCDNKNLLLKNYSQAYFPEADDVVRYLADFADHYSLRVRFETTALKITRTPEGFDVTDKDGNSYFTQRLIVASGLTKSYVPAIPGIEVAEQYANVSVDPKDFINQRVLILGKGNSGFETAENLIPTAAIIHIASPTALSLAWKTHFVGHLRAVNNNLLDTYQLKSQNAVLDASIQKIEKRNGEFVVAVSYTHANGEQEELHYDRVIVCTGFRFDDSIFDDTCKPALAINDRFPNQTSEWESTSVNDLYFAGTLSQVRDYKKGTSGFIHGFRYNALALHRILEQKYHSKPWPSHSVRATPEGLVQAVLERINRSSALWQQFAFLCDVIEVSNCGDVVRYYEEMPVGYLHDSEIGKGGLYFAITLEFGEITGDPFNIHRQPDPSKAERSTFLHPVVRRYTGSTLIAEHHVLEDLFGEWKRPVHIQPLLAFFERSLADDGRPSLE